MKRALACLAVLTLLVALPAHAGLKEYVDRPDDSYAFETVHTETRGTATVQVVKMTSQTWQGITWWHYLTLIKPATVKHPNAAMLFISGGDNKEGKLPLKKEEIRILQMVANQTNSVVAMLNQTPNQPLFGGRHEDEIIALSEVKYLDQEGDDWENWPLLFPMVKGAVRAMDTIAAVAKDQWGQDIQDFMLTGGSKRGWTTWLSAVADDRVKRIAPMIIDVLNMKPQMEHQLASYGAYSNEIDEYTQYDLQAKMDTEAGARLMNLMDPYAYRAELDLPKLVVLGANDPYWTVDAANLYYPDLPGEKHLYYQANTGHDANQEGVAAITLFYESMLTGEPYPGIAWDQSDPNAITVTWDDDGGEALLWTARSSTRDFRNATWTSRPLAGNGEVNVAIPDPSQGWVAYYVEVRFPGVAMLKKGTCSKMTVVPDTFPTFETAAGEEERAAGKQARR